MNKPISRAGKPSMPDIYVDPASGWQDLSAVSPETLLSLVVYLVRLVDINGVPSPIGRLLDRDPRALLYIGRTHDINGTRIANLIEDLQSPTARPKHGIGKKLWRTRFLERLKDGYRCQAGWHTPPSYLSQDGTQMADVILERDLLQEYCKTYGELPPFNRSLPNFI